MRWCFIWIWSMDIWIWSMYDRLCGYWISMDVFALLWIQVLEVRALPSSTPTRQERTCYLRSLLSLSAVPMPMARGALALCAPGFWILGQSVWRLLLCTPVPTSSSYVWATVHSTLMVTRLLGLQSRVTLYGEDLLFCDQWHFMKCMACSLRMSNSVWLCSHDLSRMVWSMDDILYAMQWWTRSSAMDHDLLLFHKTFIFCHFHFLFQKVS